MNCTWEIYRITNTHLKLLFFICTCRKITDKSCCCHAARRLSGIMHVCRRCVCMCVCAESCQKECVKQGAGLISLPGSYLSVQIQTGALLVCEGSREGRCFKTQTLPYPQTPHCSALHCAARWPIFLSSYQSTSVCLKLEGQLRKMITLCIKHAAVSNFSFLLFCLLSHAQIRWEKNITLGEPPGFLHSWWWYVYVDPLSFSWLHSHTQTRMFFNCSRSYRWSPLDVLKECAGVERESNCRECWVHHLTHV